jgi:hypothetical protein
VEVRQLPPDRIRGDLEIYYDVGEGLGVHYDYSMFHTSVVVSVVFFSFLGILNFKSTFIIRNY